MKETALYSYIICLSSEHILDGVSWDGIEEEEYEEGQEDDEDHLDDGPLVVVPDDVPDGLQWV